MVAGGDQEKAGLAPGIPKSGDLESAKESRVRFAFLPHFYSARVWESSACASGITRECSFAGIITSIRRNLSRIELG